MAADDRDSPLPSGWLPPQPPAPRPPAPLRPAEPSSPALVLAIALAAFSLLLLLASAGVAFIGSLVLSAVALLVATQLRRAILAGRPGREPQARAALILAWIGIGLSIAAGVVWVVLWANGVTADDLREALDEMRKNRG